MKAKEAPEKLYITYKGYGVFDEDPTVERTKDSQTEYTRTDALIKKACKFLNKELPITDLSPSNMFDITFKVFDRETKKVFIENFKKYMEGGNGMAKYRIEHRYPCYNGGCIPYDGYFVQKLKEGFLTDKWVDIKGFGDRERAEELLKILKD